jgi:hypothetical protein
VRRSIVAVSILVALASVTSANRALARDAQLELGGALAGYGTLVRAMPVTSLSAPDAARNLRGDFPSVGHLTFAGASGELTIAVDKRWFFPTAGLGFAVAVGQSPRVVSSVDGSIVAQRPWTAYMGDVLLPGIGYRVKDGRWMFSASVRTGISFTGVSGSVASGADESDATGTAASFLVRAELAGCRRLDPVERICVAVSPSVYQFGFGNSIALGLRWEFGP